MKSLYYVLAADGRTPVPCEGMQEWGLWLEKRGNRRVAFSEPRHGVEVSTVFLDLDHSFVEDGPPLLFETMVFGGSLDGEQARYSTWEEAVAGHEIMLQRCEEAP